MNKNKPILKALCAATIIALGSSAYAERVIVTHDASDNGLKKGHQVLVNGNGWFAVDLDENGKSAMRGKKGFKKMEVDAKRFPMSLYNDSAGDPNAVQVTPYGYIQSQADQLTLQAGQKVCIIDSGIAGSPGEVGGQNFDFDWGSITGDNDPGTGNWNSDGGFHGTHVAGTVGAVDNGVGVIGMAPGVPMHIIKVFNDAGWGYSSDLAQAANLCAAAGANIINMSLGGGGANSVEENAFINFTNNGGLVVASAGNDGNNVVNYPAGYPSVMMIGAVDADNVIADFSQFPPCTVTGRGKKRVTQLDTCVEISAGGVATLSTYPSGAATLSSLTADSVEFASSAMENSGSVSGSTYNFSLGENIDTGASGKVCIIERGNISFADKVLNCENSGGIGAVLFNNEPGMLYGTLGDNIASTIPAVGATQADGPALLAASTASVDVVSGNYGFSDGTSMSSPTVAGVAALVWSNNPLCTGSEVRAALNATAEDQGAAGRDDYYGNGIAKAADANTYLASTSCGGIPSNLPPTASFTSSCTLLACNFTSTSSDSDGMIASTSWAFGDGNSDSGVNASNSYAANGSYDVTMTVTDNEGASSTSTQSVTVNDGNTPLTASGSRAGGGKRLNISWSNFISSDVTITLTWAGNGFYSTATPNDGALTITGADKNTPYTVSVCEAGSTSCAPDFIL